MQEVLVPQSKPISKTPDCGGVGAGGAAASADVVLEIRAEVLGVLMDLILMVDYMMIQTRRSGMVANGRRPFSRRSSLIS